MLVITPTELRQNQSKFLDLAETQRVLIKKKNKFIELILRGESIPEFISPSGDPFFDDPRNIDKILAAEEEVKSGKVVELTDEVMSDLFGEYDV